MAQMVTHSDINLVTILSAKLKVYYPLIKTRPFLLLGCYDILPYPFLPWWNSFPIKSSLEYTISRGVSLSSLPPCILAYEVPVHTWCTYSEHTMRMIFLLLAFFYVKTFILLFVNQTLKKVKKTMQNSLCWTSFVLRACVQGHSVGLGSLFLCFCITWVIFWCFCSTWVIFWTVFISVKVVGIYNGDVRRLYPTCRRN